MPNKKYQKRLVELARSADRRLKKLPAIIRKEFRAGSDRQINAMAKIEESIELVAQETKRQCELLEKQISLSADPNS